MDRLSEMEAFAAVVEQGGFTGAAQRLGLSKSAVSKYVSSLEQRLGARLLNRTTRRVNPTDVGLIYYDRARSVLAAALEADESIGNLQAAPTGTLRVVAPSDFGTTVLAPMLTQFVERHPKLTTSLSLQSDAASETEADLVIRVGQRPDSTLRTYEFGARKRKLVASPSYLSRAGIPKRVEDLAQHPLLHLDIGEADPSWTVISPTGEPRVIRAKGPLISNSGQCLLESTLQGLGIAFLPDYLVEDALADGRLVLAMTGLPPQPLPIYVSHDPALSAEPRIRAFVEWLNSAIAGQPQCDTRAIA